MRTYLISFRILYDCIQNETHKLLICGEFNVSGILLRQQAWPNIKRLNQSFVVGYRKMLYFLCEWNRRAKQNHCVNWFWPQIKCFIPGTKIIGYEAILNTKNILLWPLYIKFKSIKLFAKILQQVRCCYTDLTYEISLHHTRKNYKLEISLVLKLIKNKDLGKKTSMNEMKWKKELTNISTF